jgi:hypothetical protein
MAIEGLVGGLDGHPVGGDVSRLVGSDVRGLLSSPDELVAISRELVSGNDKN